MTLNYPSSGRQRPLEQAAGIFWSQNVAQTISMGAREWVLVSTA